MRRIRGTDDTRMTMNQLAPSTTAQLLRWELAWVSVEILGVAAGLWLSLGTTAAELGGTVLLSVCVVSLLVRMQHYTAVRR